VWVGVFNGELRITACSLLKRDVALANPVKRAIMASETLNVGLAWAIL
jgi:hypothetical protein